jgi:3-hydroxyisobutyrate dehydrogenase-like beta-hydroxyacid dehydrogenase
MSDRKKIGLIGAGLLGTALANRLLRAGFSVFGYDRDPAALMRLEAVAGVAAASAEAVARECPRIMFSLPGPAEVAETVQKVEPHLSPGLIILDTTTGDPEQVEGTAARLAGAGVAYLDCEIGGSSRQAEAGEAIIMCGGDADAFGRSRDILEALSSRIFHTGLTGTGTRMKLALNIAIGLHRAVLAESLSFAAASGIDPERALEILKSGPAYSKAMDIKGRKMLSGDFTPEARLAQHLKDVRLILQTGEKAGAVLPLSRVHESLLCDAAEMGYGAEDNSAIIKMFQRTYSGEKSS